MSVVCISLSKYSIGVSFACVLVCSSSALAGFQCSVKQHDPFSRLVLVLSPGWVRGRVGSSWRDGGKEEG